MYGSGRVSGGGCLQRRLESVQRCGALLSVWSSRITPQRAASSFSVAIFFLTVGAFIGPILFGALADNVDLSTVFVGLAIVALATCFVRPAREKCQRHSGDESANNSNSRRWRLERG